MKFYKKRWIQSGIILISSLGIVLSVFPSFADDNIDNLKGQTSALESELDGINKDILSLSEEISATEMQVEILNGEIARTSDALVEAEENENEQYENMKSRIKYMYEILLLHFINKKGQQKGNYLIIMLHQLFTHKFHSQR